MVRCLGAFLLNGGSSFFSDVCDCQGDELYAADDDGQQQGINDQQDQACCVEYTGYKCVFCHAFCPPFPHNERSRKLNIARISAPFSCSSFLFPSIFRETIS